MKFAMDIPIGELFDKRCIFVEIHQFGILRDFTLFYLYCLGVNAMPEMHWTDGYQIWNIHW